MKLTSLVLALLLLTGCAASHRLHHLAQPIVWQMKTCAQSGDHEVCKCEAYREFLSAQGAVVRVCQ